MKLTIEQINELVGELIIFEPTLKGREAELSELIVRLAETRPEINYDENFRTRLRAEIMQLANMRMAAAVPAPRFKFNFNHMFDMKKISYGVAGAAVLILLIVPAVFLLLNQGGRVALLPHSGKKIAFETKINKVAANAFGDLRSTAETKTAPMQVARPQGGGGGAETMGAGTASGIAGGLGLGGGGGVAADASAKSLIMPPYDAVNYRYVYKGEALTAPADKLDVLKRDKGAQLNVDMGNLVSGLNFGLADIGTFSGLTVQNVSLVQQGDNGYIVSIMPDEGAVSITQNWATWPQANCGNDAVCYDNQRVKQEDIPSDSELISITDAFLAEHNIDKSVYGEPQVSPGYNFRTMYEASTDKANFYFPDSIDVVYPVKIDGKYIYDEWNGTKQGMTVSVQVKQKKVSNLYNLMTQNYQASVYDMETDTKKLLAYAEQGGTNAVQYGVEVKTVELELGDPEQVYIRYYSYKNNANEELLVPALYFPIKELPKDPNFYRKGVIVPLAKTILEERQAQILPNIYGGVSSGSGGAMLKTAPSAIDRPPMIEPEIVK
jgi:hypothetical protein